MLDVSAMWAWEAPATSRLISPVYPDVFVPGVLDAMCTNIKVLDDPKLSKLRGTGRLIMRSSFKVVVALYRLSSGTKLCRSCINVKVCKQVILLHEL